MFKQFSVNLIFALFLCVVVAGHDILRSYGIIPVLLPTFLRELFHVIIFLSFFLHLKNKVFTKGNSSVKNSINSIFRLFLLIVIMYTLIFVLNGFKHVASFGQARSGLEVKSWDTIIFMAIITYTTFYIFLKAFFHLKILIYHKRKKNTALLYKTFFLLTSIFILLTFFFDENFHLNPVFLAKNEMTLLTITNYLLVFNIVALSFRNMWVTSLNRKSKYLYFIIFLIMYLFLDSVIEEMVFGPGYQNIRLQSYTFFIFLQISYNLFLVYTVFSFAYILLNLPTAGVLDKKIKEIQSLYSLGITLGSEFDFNKLAFMITNMASEVTDSSATWFEVHNKEKDVLHIVSSQKLTSEEIRTMKLSKKEGLTGFILKEKKPKYINELKKDEKYKYIRSWNRNVSSIIGVPLLSAKGEILGIVFVTKNYEFGFDSDDITILEALSNQVAIALDNIELLEASIQKERLEQELRIAREMQQKILPQEVPKYIGFDIDAASLTANEVGGDYFDFMENQNQLGLIIADVSGKGTSAAFYMAELKGIVKSLGPIYSKSKEFFCHANKILYEQLEKKLFITASILTVSMKTKKMTLVRAGHCPLILYHTKKKEVITYKPKGLGLGMTNEKIFNPLLEEIIIPYGVGDIAVLYTDGISEARDEKGNEYGESQINEIIKNHSDKSAKELKNLILNDVVSFVGKAKMHDDITLMIIKYNEKRKERK